MKLKIEYIGLVALIAAVIGLIAFFLGWTERAGATGSTGGFSGLDYLLQDGGLLTLHAMIVIVALIGAIITMHAEFIDRSNLTTKILFLLFGAFIVVVAVSMILTVEKEAALGIYLELTVGVILTLAALFLLIKKGTPQTVQTA